MIKNTIHTTEIDTLYRKEVELLKSRKYPKALYILDCYRDRDTVIRSYDVKAYEILKTVISMCFGSCAKLHQVMWIKHIHRSVIEVDSITVPPWNAIPNLPAIPDIGK